LIPGWLQENERIINTKEGKLKLYCLGIQDE